AGWSGGGWIQLRHRFRAAHLPSHLPLRILTMTRKSFAPASVRVVAPLLALAAATLLVSCDAFKPTDVVNPNITDKQFIGTPGAGAAWVLGTQRQFLLTYNQVVQNAELVSDNYFNNYTTNNQLF